MFTGLFDKLKLPRSDITSYLIELVGFTGDQVQPLGYLELLVTLREASLSKTMKTKFLVVDCPSAYNAILGRPNLVTLEAIPSTIHLALQFYTTSGEIPTIQGNQLVGRDCYS